MTHRAGIKGASLGAHLPISGLAWAVAGPVAGLVALVADVGLVVAALHIVLPLTCLRQGPARSAHHYLLLLAEVDFRTHILPNQNSPGEYSEQGKRFSRSYSGTKTLSECRKTQSYLSHEVTLV